MSAVVSQPQSEPGYPPGWLVGQLPVGMRDDDLLVRFVTIFERVATTLRAGADGIEHAADISVAPPGMLRFLGSWLGRDLVAPEQPIAEARELVAALGAALPLRGTAWALETLLSAVVGGPVRVEDGGGVFREGQAPPAPGRVRVVTGSTGHLRRHEFEALVRDEVPAHLQIEVVVEEQPAAARVPSAGEEKA